MNDETVVDVHWGFWAIGAATLIYNIAGVINFFTKMNADAIAAMNTLAMYCSIYSSNQHRNYS